MYLDSSWSPDGFIDSNLPLGINPLAGQGGDTFAETSVSTIATLSGNYSNDAFEETINNDIPALSGNSSNDVFLEGDIIAQMLAFPGDISNDGFAAKTTSDTMEVDGDYANDSYVLGPEEVPTLDSYFSEDSFITVERMESMYTIPVKVYYDPYSNEYYIYCGGYTPVVIGLRRTAHSRKNFGSRGMKK